MSNLVAVGADEILTVTADVGSYGTVWEGGTTRQWSVGAKAPLRLGPGLYRIETIKGTVGHSVSGSATEALAAALPRATEIVRAGADIATAINQRDKPVSAFADKFRLLAEQVKEIPAGLEARVDPLFPRLAGAKAKGHAAAGKLESHVAGLEDGVAAIEDVANQISNAIGDVPNG